MLATANNRSEQVDLFQACAAMNGSACNRLDTVQFATWQDLETQLLAWFGEKVEVLASKLYNCKQRRMETVAQLQTGFAS